MKLVARKSFFYFTTALGMAKTAKTTQKITSAVPGLSFKCRNVSPLLNAVYLQ